MNQKLPDSGIPIRFNPLGYRFKLPTHSPGLNPAFLPRLGTEQTGQAPRGRGGARQARPAKAGGAIPRGAIPNGGGGAGGARDGQERGEKKHEENPPRPLPPPRWRERAGWPSSERERYHPTGGTASRRRPCTRHLPPLDAILFRSSYAVASDKGRSRGGGGGPSAFFPDGFQMREVFRNSAPTLNALTLGHALVTFWLFYHGSILFVYTGHR